MAFPHISCTKDRNTMKVILRQSGGYTAPLGRQTCEFDTSTMGAAEAETLQSLVRTSGLLESQQTVWKAPQGADLITYVLTIEDTEGSRQFSFDEMSIPTRALALLDHLLDRCQ